MGNASSATPPAGQSMTYFQYARIHPSVLADVRLQTRDHFAGDRRACAPPAAGHHPGGLSLDARYPQRQRRGPQPHRPDRAQPGGAVHLRLQIDTRDSEVTPHSGTFDEVKFKVSPGEDGAFRSATARSASTCAPTFRWRGVTLAGASSATSCSAVRPWRSSRASRTPTSAATTARGAAQRYYGKVKVFGNVEPG